VKSNILRATTSIKRGVLSLFAADSAQKPVLFAHPVFAHAGKDIESHQVHFNAARRAFRHFAKISHTRHLALFAKKMCARVPGNLLRTEHNSRL